MELLDFGLCLLAKEHCWQDSAQPVHGWTDKGNPGSLQAGQPESRAKLRIMQVLLRCSPGANFWGFARHP